MATGVRKTGDFCWINMLTPDPAGSREFYSKLFGWTYGDMGGMGDLIRVNGKTAGAMFDLNGPNSPPDMPPVIGVMVRVDSADDAVARAKSLGGTSKPAFDIMENGRMGEIIDPNGAHIDVWQAKAQQAADHDTSDHGATSWFENLTTDVAAAEEFYTQLFGWTTEKMQMPGMEYTMFKLGDTPIAGMMQITSQMGPVPPHWAVYFTVDDADASAKKAEELGGNLFMPIVDIPSVGRMAGVQSPQGVMFYIIKYSQRM